MISRYRWKIELTLRIVYVRNNDNELILYVLYY